MSEEKPSESIAVSLGDGRNLRGRQGAGNMGNEGGMLAREVDAPAEHAGAAASVDVAGSPAMRHMIRYRKARRASSIRS